MVLFFHYFNTCSGVGTTPSLNAHWQYWLERNFEDVVIYVLIFDKKKPVCVCKYIQLSS